MVAIVNEKVECPPGQIGSNSSASPFGSNSTDGVTCHQYRYPYDQYMTAQFLAAYFYGL